MSTITAQKSIADREKGFVALSSVLAAIFLTAMKITIGVLTGSLGILSEAAHSALDLVAAVVTLFAVRVSSKPPDREHAYGHGKVENLSALFETALLLVTCLWIIYEAIQRLFFKTVEVEANLWAFLIMAVSIGVDFSRSRALGRAAKKYNSQALEADALHFSTDIWSSAVVIVGLGLVFLSGRLDLPWLAQADAVAALGVAGIVVYVSLQLGKRTVADLLDSIAPGVYDEVIGAVRRIPGVQEIHRLRLRRSGPEVFADLDLIVSREVSFESAHAIADQAEETVQGILPGADVVVHVSPPQNKEESYLSAVHNAAARQGLSVHGIRLYTLDAAPQLELHLEVDDSLRLDEAHAQAEEFERLVREAVPSIRQVITHLEPAGERTSTRQTRSPARRAAQDRKRVLEACRELSEESGSSWDVHDLSVHRLGEEVSISFHCLLAADMPIAEAHSLTEKIEVSLRARLPDLGRVVIHVEPNSLN